MAKVEWDEAGKRIYESGIDQGVLYLTNRLGVAWSGLISLEEISKEDTSIVYLDGVKISDIYSSNDLEATLTAFTYPEEFSSYQGIEIFEESGMEVSGQSVLPFGLAFRTLIGNDVSGTEHGYQIHLLYNLVAVPQDLDYTTISNSIDPLNFSWSLTSYPEQAQEFYPTSHVIVDSRTITADRLQFIEDILYGTKDKVSIIKFASIDTYQDTQDYILPASIDDVDIVPESIIQTEVVYFANNPSLPSLEHLLLFIPYFDPQLITPNEATGYAIFEYGYGDVTQTGHEGLYLRLPLSRLESKIRDDYYVFNPVV